MRVSDAKRLPGGGGGRVSEAASRQGRSCTKGESRIEMYSEGRSIGEGRRWR